MPPVMLMQEWGNLDDLGMQLSPTVLPPSNDLADVGICCEPGAETPPEFAPQKKRDPAA